MKNKISVILPVYNGEKTIERAIMSLIKQSFKALKVIVIDDGSTDKTAQLVKKIQCDFPGKVIYHYQTNQGIAASRNFGLSKVDTEFFGFLDADDYVEFDMYQLLYEKIETTNSDVCSCDFYWTYPDSKKLKLAIDGPYANPKEALEKMFMTLWNKLYRTDFIKKLDINFPDGLRYEDAYFLYCLLPHLNKLTYVAKPLVYYVQVAGSITHTYNINIQDMMAVFKGIKQYYQEHHYDTLYHSELEYIFIRFFLGNSYLRTCNIDDKLLRNKTLTLAWDFLNQNFPQWHNNSYLKTAGLKNKYFRIMNRKMYFFNVYLFRILYKLKIMQ